MIIVWQITDDLVNSPNFQLYSIQQQLSDLCDIINFLTVHILLMPLTFLHMQNFPQILFLPQDYHCIVPCILRSTTAIQNYFTITMVIQ